MTLPAASTSSSAYMIADDTSSPLGNFTQSSLSSILFTIDYSDWLLLGETVSSVTAAVSPTTTTLFTASQAQVVAVDGGASNGISLLGGAGADGQQYIVTVSIVTSSGQTKVDTFFVSVAEAGGGVASMGAPVYTAGALVPTAASGALSGYAPVGANNFATGSLTLSSNSGAPTTILAARTGSQGVGRISADIENIGNDVIFVGAKGTATNTWVEVEPGGSITFRATAEIDGYGNSGAQTVKTIEFW